MVKHSLKKLLDKYPYFLDKRSTSNLYKVTDVNNSIFKDLYNSLFHTYESFHLNKRLLVWRTQTEPYVYQTHFHCSYPNIRTVEVYKNDVLIHRESFTEEEKKTDYDWTYECSYIKTNMLPMNVYICLQCEDLHENDPVNHTQSIYIGDELPIECHECGSNIYSQIRLWECEECGEIYFANLNEYGELDITCKNNCDATFTEVYAYKCLGQHDEENNQDSDEIGSDLEDNCGEIYIGKVPPTVCQVCGVAGYIDDMYRLYYNDDTILINDNSTEYYDNEVIIVDENSEINHVNTHIVVTEESIEEGGSGLKIPFPVIPDDLFKFYVETWDEYYITKGFPENDVSNGDEFDHDYSLDEIGDLNNIPRKEYDIVEENLYSLTEPPYNKYATEDDYHYMNRMIEYNLRMWSDMAILDVKDGEYESYINFLESIGISLEDYNRYVKIDTRSFREEHNPVSLELWKRYGISSRLVNRERLLLKLFDVRRHNPSYRDYYVDEDGYPLLDSNGSFKYKDNWEVVTDLVECWTPQQWEHKDKFCSPTEFYGEYLYVVCDNLRPVPHEEVYFTHKLLNSLNEDLNVNYYLKIYVYYSNKKQKKLLADYTNNTFILKPSDIQSLTQVEFEAYNSETDALIDTCLVTLNPRTCSNADIYVNKNSTKSKQNGTSTYPYKDLQTALNKVNQNYNVIALKSDIDITEELIIQDNTKIIGCITNSTPIIKNTNSNKFFKIIGGKNCNLTLSNISLQSPNIISPVVISSWTNKNDRIDDYVTVINRGGLVIINATVDKDIYYPTDTIHITGNVTDKDGNRLVNETIRINFDREYIGDTLTDDYGEFSFSLNTDKIEKGEYDLEIRFISDNYFSTTESIKVNCTKDPISILTSGGNVLITSTNQEPNIDVYVSVDGEVVTIDNDPLVLGTDANGTVSYNYPSTWGKHIIVFRDEQDNVLDMIIVETTVGISSLVGKYFVKDWIINDDGDIIFDRFKFTANHTFGDLNNVLKSLEVNEVYVDSDTLTISEDRFNATDLLASECEKLSECITKVVHNTDTTLISYSVLGAFWGQ